MTLPARRGGLLGPGIAVAIGVAVTCGLGAWQMQRLAWKEDLLARLEAGRNSAPAPLPAVSAWAGMTGGENEYRRFSARGAFEPAQALVFAGPVATPTGAAPGYYVMAVLDIAGGGRLLVHRGVIPIGMRDAVPPPPQGEVTIAGMFRAPERPGWFTPDDNAAKASFLLRDPARLAPALGPGLSPFFLDEERGPGEPEGWPRKGVGSFAPPNNHLSYAMTWFALAATLLVFFVIWARRRGA